MGLWVRISPGGHGYLSVVSVVFCQVEVSVRRADHLCREVLPNVVCLCVCSRNLVNEETLARDWAAVTQGKKYKGCNCIQYNIM